MRRPFHFAHTPQSSPARAPRIRDAVHLRRQDLVPCSGDANQLRPTLDEARCWPGSLMPSVMASLLSPQTPEFPFSYLLVVLLLSTRVLCCRSSYSRQALLDSPKWYSERRASPRQAKKACMRSSRLIMIFLSSRRAMRSPLLLRKRRRNAIKSGLAGLSTLYSLYLLLKLLDIVSRIILSRGVPRGLLCFFSFSLPLWLTAWVLVFPFSVPGPSTPRCARPCI